jgi:amino acid adenylation domain-containing protein
MNSSNILSSANRSFLERAVPPFSCQASSYPREKTVAQLFEEAAAKYPDRAAVICGDKRLTYSQLNHRANVLAHRLRQSGVTAESMVGVCVERSEGLIVAILGVLKAGGAYVPFDPQYPRERIAFMLADTRTYLMVTRREMADSVLTGCSAAMIFLEDFETEALPTVAANPESIAGPRSLAYVLYTSGSTGRPKGVLVENRSIVRLVFNTNYCQFGPQEVFLHFAPISFDASTFEIWGALLHGSTLVVLPAGTFSLPQIGQAIRENNVTTVWLTAGFFHLFVDERIEDLCVLKQLLAGGDVLSARHVRQILEAAPLLTLINGYGPTEGTTFTACHVMRHGDLIPDSVPIGKPVSNSSVYLLDDNLRPVAPGAEGELFAAGDGIARGYLNSPELTAERFLPDPYASDSSSRMYRTGDRARWRDSWGASIRRLRF